MKKTINYEPRFSLIVKQLIIGLQYGMVNERKKNFRDKINQAKQYMNRNRN